MSTRKFTLLLTLIGILTTFVLLLTITHSDFSCQVQGGDEHQNSCAELGITPEQDTICEGFTFTAAIYLTQKKVHVTCPWSHQSYFIIITGCVISLVYTIFTLFQRKHRSMLSGKLLLILGLLGSSILIGSISFMGFDLYQGWEKCREFSKDIIDSTTNCNIGVYGVTVVLEIVCLGILMYEILIGSKKFKDESMEFEAEIDGVYVRKNDISTELFKDKTEDP